MESLVSSCNLFLKTLALIDARAYANLNLTCDYKMNFTQLIVLILAASHELFVSEWC